MAGKAEKTADFHCNENAYMRNEQTILADFLNHGTLPFVGREDVIGRIEKFVAEIIDATSLRSLLVIGEAGIGKTTLTEEIIRRVEGKEAIVIHARLRPASSTSPVALLSDALRISPTARPLLRKRLGTTLEEIVEALRRLCRLRPTLVIIEDIHLLEGDTLRDFAGLLTALADDPAAFLCSARPHNESALQLLEASLIDRIMLEGLNKNEIGTLGETLFGKGGDSSAIETLSNTTLGNPLAIRGALRGALRQETIQRDNTGRWRADERFDEVIQRGAESISEGLAATLTPEERQAAEQLACLGEIFSVEAAEVLLGDNASTMIHHLLFKGILVRSLTAVPALPETKRSKEPLLAFTHTLVHHKLLEESSPSIGSIATTVLQNYPLYSIIPFETITKATEKNQKLLLPLIQQLVQQVIKIAQELDKTSEWMLGLRLADTMIEGLQKIGTNSSTKRQAELDLYNLRLELLVRELHGKDFDRTLQHYKDLTKEISDNGEISHYMLGLVHEYKRIVYAEHDGDGPNVLEEKIDQFTKDHPEQIQSEGYVQYLTWKAERAALRGDWKRQEQIEKHIESLVSDPDYPAPFRIRLESALRTDFLVLVRTPEELQKRLHRLEEENQDERRHEVDASWLLHQARFYGFTGHFKKQWELYSDALSISSKRGQSDITQSLEESIIKCQVALGSSLEEAEETLLRIKAISIQRGNRPPDPIVINNLTAIALLRGEVEWAVRFYDTYFVHERTNPTYLPHLLALWRDNPAEAWMAESDHSALSDIRIPVTHLLDKNASEEELDKLNAFLNNVVSSEPIAMRHVLMLEVALRLLELHSETLPDAGKLKREGALKVIAWSQERELWTFIEATLQRFGSYLGEDELTAIEKTLAELQEKNAHLVESKKTDRKHVNLSLFGTIEATHGKTEEVIRPRGERLKTLLGVMVANEILDTRLSRDEFLRIASGQDGTSRQARDVVNKTVSRLRESLETADVILTDEETPRLNRDFVDVDLLEAVDALQKIRTYLRQRNLMKAIPMIRNVLTLWKGDVPFPTLYDEFFETLRDEFEAGVRETGLQVAEELLNLGDAPRAEELLKTLINYMPEDEELIELQIRALGMLGKKTDAMRARLSMVEM